MRLEVPSFRKNSSVAANVHRFLKELFVSIVHSIVTYYTSLKGDSLACIMSATSSSLPSAAGQRLLHLTVDEIAVNSPGRIWAAIPRSTTLSDGYRDISFAALANAINRLSWFLESRIGRSKSFETVAYLGPCMNNT